MRKSYAVDMTRGPIAKELVLFSLPLLAGNLFQQFYNTVDSIVVGNFVGAYALGAVTSVGPVTNTLIGFFMGLATGSSVVISQYFGAKDACRLRKSIHTSIIMTLLLAGIFMCIGYAATPKLLSFMQTPAEVVPEAIVYLRIYFLGIASLMLYNMGSGILRAVGDSRHPLYYLILSSLLNIVLDLLFVIGFKNGVAGVAYATIISQFISDLFIFGQLAASKECYSISLSEMHLDFSIFKRIFWIGFPAGLQMALTSFSNIFVQSYINSFGAGATSGWGAYGRIDSFILLPMQAIGLAVTTFVGQNAGARSVERIKRGIRDALLTAAGVTIPLSLLTVSIAPHTVRLFNQDAAVLYYGALFLRLNEPFDVFCCFNQIYAGALRGTGDAKTPMCIMLFSFVLCRQVYLFLISRVIHSIYPIALGYPFGWAICSLTMFLYFKNSHWEQKLSHEAHA